MKYKILTIAAISTLIFSYLYENIKYKTVKNTENKMYSSENFILEKKELKNIKTLAAPLIKEPIRPIEKKVSKKLYNVVSGDSLYKVFYKYGFKNDNISEILKLMVGEYKSYKSLNISDKIYITKEDENIKYVDIYKDNYNYLRISVIEKEDKLEFTIKKEVRETYIEIAVSRGVIENSLYYDGIKSGLDNNLVVQLSNVFAWDIDFARDLSVGDKFYVAYENIKSEGEVIESGNILFALFKTKKDDFYAIFYDEDNSYGYYDIEGESLEKAFIRSPVKFPRITSKFTYNRYHPVLKISRPHRGVDYGGKLNTKIMATGSGVISYIGKTRGYGNHIIIDHGQGYQTLYAHMNKFSKNLKKGSFVDQSQVIGYMGKTGLATGVHLHYEFRINGVHKDALKIKLPDGKPVSNIESFNKIKYYYMSII